VGPGRSTAAYHTLVEAQLVHAARRTAVSTNILCKFSSRGRARRLRLVVFLFLFKCINLFVLDYYTPLLLRCIDREPQPGAAVYTELHGGLPLGGPLGE
jgi:hypothetical protein